MRRKDNDSSDTRCQGWSRYFLPSLIGATVVIGIFLAGVSVGNGTLHFSTSSENSGLPSQLDYSSVNQVYDALKNNYNGKLTTSQLLDGLKHGLAKSTGDPYTEYFTPSEVKQFNDELNNSFSGIGAELSQDKDGNLEIIAPIHGFPAAKAGLQPKDIIAQIDGKTTSGMSVDQAVTKIRGKSGTKVKLTVVRDHAKQMNFTITRATIQVPSVTSKILPGNVGYIQIATFADDTSGLAQKAAQDLKNHHVKSIILDLRDNPGGLLSAAVDVSSLWLRSGQTILTEKGTTGDQTYTATGNDILHGVPTVVLINSGSASASEITTGALHDNHDAYVIGTKSFGKGVVQTVVNLSGGAELKVTVASWYRPNGTTIEHKGITPDKKLDLDITQLKAGHDNQLQAARDYLEKQ